MGDLLLGSRRRSFLELSEQPFFVGIRAGLWREIIEAEAIVGRIVLRRAFRGRVVLHERANHGIVFSQQDIGPDAQHDLTDAAAIGRVEPGIAIGGVELLEQSLAHGVEGLQSGGLRLNTVGLELGDELLPLRQRLPGAFELAHEGVEGTLVFAQRNLAGRG